jgi:hypothetical protein
VVLYSNGATSASQTTTLSGTLASGDVFVIYNGDSVTEITSVGDISGNVTFFNGDDAIVLEKTTDGGTTWVAIDVFGIVGEDPGSAWDVGTGSTANVTLVRKPGVVGGSTTWNPEEWIVYPANDFSYLGSHTAS